MISKLNNFLLNHRLFLVLFILILISILFITLNLTLFFHHKFTALTCDTKKDEEICLNNKTEILSNPTKTLDNLFKEYAKEIKTLQDEYKLPEFNFYTAYYYLEASNYDLNKNNRNATLNTYLNLYINTYNLKEFYEQNNIYFSIFYPYKLI